MRAANTVPAISIIVPTLNEAERIESTLCSIPPAPEVEVIVVDGGSRDDTVARAYAQGVRVLVAGRGRARQMNVGAGVAKGELYLFLHADTILPEGYDYQVRRILMHPDVSGGAFRLHIEPSSASLRLIEIMANWRSRRLQMPYGDQAIFVRASTFEEVRGFPELPIMEDYEFVRRLQRMGQIAIAPGSVKTSARRWQQLGVWRTTAINQAVLIGYGLGVSPERLARWYRGKECRNAEHST